MRTLPGVVAGLLTVEEAAARLGVKPATLYAYVRRGLLRRQRGADGRSRFALADLDRLGRQGRRDRATSTELTIESALTAIEDGAIFYRGEDVFRLAVSRTFEEVAEFLWVGEFPEGRAWDSDPGAVEHCTRVQRALPTTVLPLDRLRVGVASAGAMDQLLFEIGEAAVAVTGRRLIATLVDSLPGADKTAGLLRVRPGQPLSASLAARLWAGLGEAPAPRGGPGAL